MLLPASRLFAEILSLPNDGRYPTLEMAPRQRRQRTMEALTAQIEAPAHRASSANGCRNGAGFAELTQARNSATGHPLLGGSRHARLLFRSLYVRLVHY